jgi:hypothetical protein
MLFVFVYFDMTKLLQPLAKRLTHFSGRIAQKYERGRFVIEPLISATKKLIPELFNKAILSFLTKKSHDFRENFAETKFKKNDKGLVYYR